MKKVVSDDSARKALLKIEEEEGVERLREYLQQCYEPLLRIPWIMDVDVTIKTIYGSQEGTVVGYNPHKRGRPSHTYHTLQTNLCDPVSQVFKLDFYVKNCLILTWFWRARLMNLGSRVSGVLFGQTPPPFLKLGRSIHYRVEDLKAWLDQQQAYETLAEAEAEKNFGENPN